MKFNELDIITLTHDIPEHDLNKGDIGAIVFDYGTEDSYEIEFVDPSGETKALLQLTPSDIQRFENSTTVVWIDRQQPSYTENNSKAKTEEFYQQYI